MVLVLKFLVAAQGALNILHLTRACQRPLVLILRVLLSRVRTLRHDQWQRVFAVADVG